VNTVGVELLALAFVFAGGASDFEHAAKTLSVTANASLKLSRVSFITD
jgi:hypothetical protein